MAIETVKHGQPLAGALRFPVLLAQMASGRGRIGPAFVLVGAAGAATKGCGHDWGW